MAVRVAINGFGRIGRYLTRVIASGQKDVDLVAINSRGDTQTLAHLLRFDSIHGPFQGTVEAATESLIINGKQVYITAIDDPHRLPWKDLGVQIVLESTGAFRDRISNERHLAAALSMLPTTTGAARAVTEVIPELVGRLDGLAVRVPTPNVSLVDPVAVGKATHNQGKGEPGLCGLSSRDAERGLAPFCGPPGVD